MIQNTQVRAIRSAIATISQGQAACIGLIADMSADAPTFKAHMLDYVNRAQCYLGKARAEVDFYLEMLEYEVHDHH